MNEFLTTLLQAVLIAVVPVCVRYIAKGIKTAAAYFAAKSQSDTEKKYINAVADAVSTAVTYTSQVYVDKLKEQGEFSKENQQEALGIAIAQAKNMLTKDAADFLQSAYGDLNEYLKSRIEAEVRNQKQGFITLTQEL